VPLDRFREARFLQGPALLLFQNGVGLQDVQLRAGSEAGMVFLDGQEEVTRQPADVGSLLDQVEEGRAAQNFVKLIGLPGQQFAQHRSRGYRCKKVASLSGPGLAGGVETQGGMIEGFFHEPIEGQRAVLPDFRNQEVDQGGVQGFSILFGLGKGGEIDDRPPPFKLRKVKQFLGIVWLSSGLALAQTANENPSLKLTDLPSAEAETRLPGVGEPAPSPDMSDVQPTENPSIPNLRSPAAEKERKDESDWAAQAMLQKQEEAKKKQQEEVALAEQKARESQEVMAKEKREKEAKAVQASKQPAVAGPAAPGLGEEDAQKLPVVTGLDGVKPRAMASGDGRVQPGFDSFTGPSGTGPLGKDFQSGAKPIMAGNTRGDGRMQVPQAPEPPSGGYKRISQDPYTLPAGYGEKKPVPPPPAPKPVAIPPNPPTGDPKRVIDDTKAGFSPYDNTRKVPDPRSQRRF